MRIILVVFLLISSVTMAQNGTTSPYSFYGLGALNFKGTVENRTMGGISVYSDSIHLGVQNPASIADLELINYAVGVSHKETTQKTVSQTQQQSTTSFDYFAVAIPMGRLVSSFGLLPYSSVGYDTQNVVDDVTTRYTGEGGLNKAFLTFAYKLSPNFSFGVETNYNFGNIENTAFSEQVDLELGAREQNRSELRGFSLNVGASYKALLAKTLQVQPEVV